MAEPVKEPRRERTRNMQMERRAAKRTWRFQTERGNKGTIWKVPALKEDT